MTNDSWDIPALGGFPGAYMKSMIHWLSDTDFLRLTSTLQDRRIFLQSYLVYIDAEQTKVFFNQREGIMLTEIRERQDHLFKELLVCLAMMVNQSLK